MALMKISGIGLLFLARHLALLRQYPTEMDCVNKEYQINRHLSSCPIYKSSLLLILSTPEAN